MRYLVLGRKSYAQPLEEQGMLEAPDAESARRQARSGLGEGWVELVLVPLDQVRWVLQAGAARLGGMEVESRVD